MNLTFRNLSRGLAASLLATAAAHAQIPGSLCSVVPMLGFSNGTAAPFASNWSPCPIDDAYNVLGTHPTAGGSLFQGDLRTALGGNTYRMRLDVQSAANLVPLGLPVGGTPSDAFGLIVGNELGPNGYPLQFSGAEAVFVTAMDFHAYDLAGNQVLGPIDVRQHADLSSVDAGSGWDGNVAFLVPQSLVTTAIGRLELIIDYRIGLPHDWWVAGSSGCSPVVGGNAPNMELTSAATIGQLCTISAGSVPYPTLGMWLVFGSTTNNQISLSTLGSDPACYLRAAPDSVVVAMPVDPSGVYDNALTFAIPPDPMLVGAEFGMQTLGIYGLPQWPSNGFYTGQYGELTIGG